MLLNHVLVGILLLPLGGLTAYAARSASQGVRWALIVCRTNAATVAMLPATLFMVMGTRYFTAVPFLIATAIVCAASLTPLVATFWPIPPFVDVKPSPGE